MRRRTFLALGTAGIGLVAGCSSQPGSGTAGNARTEATTQSPTKNSTASAGKTAHTSTAVATRKPVITDYYADPEDKGTILAIGLTGESGDEHTHLERAEISYGSRELTRRLDDATTSIDGYLEDIPGAGGEGEVAYVLEDTAGNTKRVTHQLDVPPPTVTVRANSTEKAGEIEADISAEDETGLASLRAYLNANRILQEDLSGRLEYTTTQRETVDDSRSGESNTVWAEVTNPFGGERKGEAESYVRKFDRDAEGRLNIGVDYMPQAGEMFKATREHTVCVYRKEPRIGEYFDPIPPEVTSRHIDQITAHKIPRVTYDFQGFERNAGSSERLRTFIESDLISQIEVTPRWNINAFQYKMDRSWKDEIVPWITGDFRDHLLENDDITVSTFDGRPVIDAWGTADFVQREELTEKLHEEWSGYEAFVADLRSQLTVAGTDPFLIGGMGWRPYNMEDGRVLARQFNAVSNWVAPSVNDRAGETYEWESVIPEMINEYQEHRDYAVDNDMEFVPEVFPGFDDRGNECWGPRDEEGNRLKQHIPRSQDRFRELLNLAAKYATTDMINIATWNDWAEGTQVEPGTHRGTDYGTAYLEVVEEFQMA